MIDWAGRHDADVVLLQETRCADAGFPFAPFAAAGYEVGDAFLLLVIENVWAAGFANALRESGVVFAQQDYLSREGLVALGAMLGLEVALALEGFDQDDVVR